MNDDDLLQRAARALRDQPPDDPAGLEARRRVLERVESEQRASAQRVAVIVPLLAVIVASTAIAAVTGALPRAWQKLTHAHEDPPRATELPARTKEPAAGRVRHAPAHAIAAPPVAAPAPVAPVEPAAAAAPPAVEVPAAAAPPAVEVPPLAAEPAHRAPVHRGPARGQAASHAEAVVAPAESPAPAAVLPAPAPPPPAAPADDTLALFRTAQGLHFREHAWARALVAWDAYLRAAPHGDLAPEARWNRALCLVRLGRARDARRALEPFATGSEAGYRQAEARSLLDALPAEAPGP